MMKPIRILMGKVGLDGHDRGAKVVMAALRDAGMEVIFSGLHQSPEALVRAAIEEDVDVIGLSILSGSHNDLVPLVMTELKKQSGDFIPVVLGGIIPEQDFSFLKKQGISAIFTPGTRLDEIVRVIQGLAQKPKTKINAETKPAVRKMKATRKKTKKATKKTTKKASKKKTSQKRKIKKKGR
jgi:methylmalonyl-CoA mutase C-terminal domain/subunit